MIIAVPTAHLSINSETARGVQLSPPRACAVFKDQDFVSNVVYVDFARGPPCAKEKAGTPTVKGGSINGTGLQLSDARISNRSF